MEGERSVLRAMSMTTGSMRAATATLFMNADSPPAMTMMITTSIDSPSAGDLEQLPAENIGDAGAGQSAAEDEDRPDGHHRRIAEPGQGFFGADDIGDRQHAHDQHGQYLKWRPFGDQKDDDRNQNSQYRYDFCRHNPDGHMQ
jgi:hypothetical protein